MRGVYRSATFENKASAREWAAETEAAIRAGGVISTSGTVADLLDRYAAEVSAKRAPESASRETERLAAIKGRALGDVPLSDLRRGDIADYRDERLKEVKASTVNRELNLLSGVFQIAAEEWHLLAANPCHGLRRPTNPPPRDRRIPPEDAEAICEELGFDGEHVYLKRHEIAVAFLIALETAMRQGEILGLQRQDVNLRGRYCTLPETKNGDRRNVALSRRAIELLGLLPGEGDNFFTVASNTCSSEFTQAAKRAGLPISFHDSRHEAITRLAQKLNIMELARMVGHRDPRSLMIYYNATASEIAARLD
ncbi:tyrosine-type recombinase/integrase [Alloalcanivorax xenomutans]|uniref:tyrosine-type recombinase/integrase n=1 Tax=Alloalcanivorax xenomutans TaxID=1094342 RepID=UPI003D9AB9E6